MKRVKLYLWDIDGTLISCGGAGLRSLERACRELHDIEQASRGVVFAGNTDRAICDELFRAHLGRAPEEAEIDALLVRYLEHLEEEVARSPTYKVLPGVTDALATLDGEGRLMGLCTGNISDGARIKLTRGALWHRFAFGGFGCDAHARKDVVARAIERGCAAAGRRLEPEEILVIGDTPRDIAAAHANGVRCLAVATGPFPVDVLREAQADLVIETLDELPALLGR